MLASASSSIGVPSSSIAPASSSISMESNPRSSTNSSSGRTSASSSARRRARYATNSSNERTPTAGGEGLRDGEGEGRSGADLLDGRGLAGLSSLVDRDNGHALVVEADHAQGVTVRAGGHRIC